MTGALAVAIKEFRQILRDRRTLVVLLFVPAFFLFVYGYALNFDIRHVSLAVQDRDHSVESRELIANFTHSTYFDLASTPSDDADIAGRMDRSTARAALVIPEGFGREVRVGEPAQVQVILNGDNATTATTVSGYVNAVLREPIGASTAPPAIVLAGMEPRVWYNPELKSTLFLVPGLIAYIAMIMAVIATAMSIVREKESGTMEQVRMAPISTAAFIGGKTLPYLLLSQVSATLVIVAAMLLFGVPMRGRWIDLEAVTAIFLVGALSTGLFVSTVAETQQVAFQMSALLSFLPTFILSGFIFPISSMPAVLQYVTRVVPARYFLTALRGIVLKGLPIASFGPQVGALAVYGFAMLALAAVRLAKARG